MRYYWLLCVFLSGYLLDGQGVSLPRVFVRGKEGGTKASLPSTATSHQHSQLSIPSVGLALLLEVPACAPRMPPRVHRMHHSTSQLPQPSHMLAPPQDVRLASRSPSPVQASGGPCLLLHSKIHQPTGSTGPLHSSRCMLRAMPCRLLAGLGYWDGRATCVWALIGCFVTC